MVHLANTTEVQTKNERSYSKKGQSALDLFVKKEILTGTLQVTHTVQHHKNGVESVENSISGIEIG
jgi:hypothetical protein